MLTGTAYTQMMRTVCTSGTSESGPTNADRNSRWSQPRATGCADTRAATQNGILISAPDLSNTVSGSILPLLPPTRVERPISGSCHATSCCSEPLLSGRDGHPIRPKSAIGGGQQGRQRVGQSGRRRWSRLPGYYLDPTSFPLGRSHGNCGVLRALR